MEGVERALCVALRGSPWYELWPRPRVAGLTNGVGRIWLWMGGEEKWRGVGQIGQVGRVGQVGLMGRGGEKLEY